MPGKKLPWTAPTPIVIFFDLTPILNYPIIQSFIFLQNTYICNVKNLAIILAVFFLGLNFIPCEDDILTIQQDTQVQVSDYGEHSPLEADSCSPFCQCHCCHVHVTNINGQAFESLDLAISTIIINKGANLGEELPNFHFQPPRV